MALTLNVNKFPKEGNFDCVLGKNLTIKDIEEKQKKWTQADSERLIATNNHHLLIEVEETPTKKADSTKP